MTNIKYQPLYKPNQLIFGNGKIAIVTGWTVKQAISKHLQSHDYAVIGQLYSPTRGINFLIRNLLYNPHVRYLVILNATKEDKNAGACQCLLDFFEHGFHAGVTDTGKPSWVINSPILGYIDADIPEDVLTKFRQSIVYNFADNIAQSLDFVKDFNQELPLEKWTETGLQFPLTESHPSIFPGVRYGHRIEGKTIAETYIKIIHRIKTTGTIRPTLHDGKWQELINLMAIVTDEPENFYFPEPNYLPVTRDFLQEYIGQILDDSPHQEGIKYTYGQRLRSWFGLDQIEGLINKLVADLDTARAVMSLWDVKNDLTANSPPCLNHIWVRIVDNELSLTATFRSNDMFSAWVANAMGLRSLQQYITKEINKKTDYNLKLGCLITISQSAHIYDDCWENAEKIISKEYPKLCKESKYNDPVGNFLITIQDHQIMVEHTTPGSGEVVNCYQGKTAIQLSRQIVADCPAIEVEHALYLGIELHKAEIAIAKNLIYEQDKLLK
jgi:thymidylate synthase